MSHFTDERGRHLNERIILLLNDSVADRLRQTLNADSAEFPSEALLELLARQVWAFYEEQHIHLVTRSITLIGKTVQVSRGDYALQIDSVVTTNHSMVTQAFRQGVRVETDWEIVTPLRGLPYPTTRGALQLLESLTAEENEQIIISAADSIWSQNTSAPGLQEAESIVESPAMVSPIMETSNTNETIQEGEGTADHSSENDADDPQRIIDELLGRLMTKNEVETKNETSSSLGIKETANPSSFDHTVSPLMDSINPQNENHDFESPLDGSSEKNIVNDMLSATDITKGVSQTTDDSIVDPQSLVDQWLKSIVSQEKSDSISETIVDSTSLEADLTSTSNEPLTKSDDVQSMVDQWIGAVSQDKPAQNDDISKELLSEMPFIETIMEENSTPSPIDVKPSEEFTNDGKSDDVQSLVDQWIGNIRQDNPTQTESLHTETSQNLSLNNTLKPDSLSSSMNFDNLFGEENSHPTEDIKDVDEWMGNNSQSQEESSNKSTPESLFEFMMPEPSSALEVKNELDPLPEANLQIPDDLNMVTDFDHSKIEGLNQGNISSIEKNTLEEPNPQSMVDRWIKSITSSQSNTNSSMEKESEEITVNPETMTNTIPSSAANLSEEITTNAFQNSADEEGETSKQTNDSFDFFDNLFSSFSPKSNTGETSQISEDEEPKIIPEDIEEAIHQPTLAEENISAPIIQPFKLDVNSIMPYFKGCGDSWNDIMVKWGQVSKDTLVWPRFAEMLPVRLVWMVSNHERAEAIWKQISNEYRCHRVLFQDDAILQQVEGEQDSKNKELWLGKYRQSRLTLESDSAKLRLLRSQLDLIGKYFQDYTNYKKELDQLVDRVQVSPAPAKLNTPQMNHFKKELAKLLAKQAETEERLRSWIYSSREVRHLLSPKYLELQEQYKELLMQASQKGRELNQLLSSSQEIRTVQPSENKDRARISQELADIDRYINDTYGKQWNQDPIWSLFEKKDLNGIKSSLMERESALAVEEKALSNWQNIIEELPTVLLPQIWVGSCHDASQFLFHQFYPHVIIDESGQNMESLYSTPWLVIHSDGGNITDLTAGQIEAPYDPQLFWGICGSDENCKKMTSITWDQRELSENGGKFIA